MLESTKNKVSMRKINSFVLIGALVVALAAWLVCQFAVGAEKLGFAPVLMLFIVFFLGAGLVNLALGIINKSAISVSLGGISAIIGLTILLICLLTDFWWVFLIVAVVLLVALLFAAFAVKAPVIEKSMEFDNAPDAGRKFYEERKAETEARKEEERKTEKEAELPEIKSFKD